MVFLVMQFETLTAVDGQNIINFFGLDRKLKFVGLDDTSGLAAIPFLDQFAFVGFKDIPFLDRVIQMPAFHTVAEYKKEFEINKCNKTEEDQNT